MLQKHRIYTDIGKDQNITVELKQDYDLLEILSLKFTQKDTYTSLCSDYGVVCGRIIVNNGFGIPNAKISIFIPLSDEDSTDPVISALYPFKDPSERNEETNYRYNLLPARKQHGGHEPTGTFPDQLEVLNREEVLEVYEKYYKYTVKTNDSGDFMIWGVPLGLQKLHVDIDLSDIGCFSLRPYDFMKQGVGEDAFKNTYTFKSSEDIDSLPQIVSFDKTVEVVPFWGNIDLCQIGITRTDFDLSDKGVKIEPKAFLIGGTYTDTGKNSLNKNCQPRRKMGRKCDLTTKTGKIEAIRFTHKKDINKRPILETYNIDEDIPEDGAFVMEVPMNSEFIYTNEFGENEITNDPNKGIPTAACYRFRFSMDDQGNSRVRKTASYLVPNIREYSTQQNESYAFSTSWDDYPTSAVGSDSNRGILYNQSGQYFPRDYFYRVTYNKVYTISSFQNIHYNGNSFSDDRYVGIKEIVPAEEEDCSADVVTPPVNFAKKNFTFSLLIADVLLLLEHLLNLVILTLFNTLAIVFHNFADAFNQWPTRFIYRPIKRFAYRLQDGSQRELYLIAYPECEECNGENSLGVQGGLGNSTDFCEVGKVKITGNDSQSNRSLVASGFNFSNPASGDPGDICYSAATPTNVTNFISNQSSYIITYGSNGTTLTGTTIFAYDGATSGYTFQDTNGLFQENIEYEVIIRNLNASSNPFSSIIPLEDGCELYDIPYDEDIVSTYYIGTGRTPSSTYTAGMDVTATKITDSGGFQLVSSFDGEGYTPITPSGFSEFTNGIFKIIPGSQKNVRIFEILREYRRRKRVGKLFCGGIVNYSFIDNWLSGSLYFFQFKGKKGRYCEDVIRYVEPQDKYYYRSATYTSESNWGGSKDTQIGRPTTMVDLGPRDEFIKEICIDPSLDPNCSVSRSIGPTSFQSFGELLGLAINYRMDVSNNRFDINDFFNNEGFTYTSRVLDGDILQLISINNEVGIEEFDLQNAKYLGYSYQYLDPEIFPSVFKNGTSVYGPLPVTMYLDEDGERVRGCLNEPGRLTEASQKVPFFLWNKGGPGFGPYNVTTLDNQSWDYTTQVSISNGNVQPLQGMTYGYSYTTSPNDLSDQYLLLPMTYTFSGLTINTDNSTNDVIFDSILPSGSTIAVHNSEYPGFTVLVSSNSNILTPTSGTLYTRVGPVSGNTTYQGITITNGFHQQPWDYTDDFIIRPTMDYYSGNKQILSTPFMFYFGLKAGKTGIDKFIKLFGDKGAFTSAE
jgi:hypothetical protein